jgi:hypothetical protein
MSAGVDGLLSSELLLPLSPQPAKSAIALTAHTKNFFENPITISSILLLLNKNNKKVG